MNTRLLSLILAALLLASCRGRSSMQRGQQNYEVVEEGQAGGVSSTINGPGEAPPPPLTNTNADTTTAFTAFPNGPTTTATMGQPGSLGATLPPPTSGGVGTYYPATPRPRPQPAPPPMTSASPRPAPQPEPQPAPETQTVPQTDTTATTTTTAPPPSDQPEPEPAPPPPPPPTPPPG